MRSPRRVHELVAVELRGLERERFLVLLLDGKHRLKRREVVSEGTLTTSLVHPREVFRPAVRESAAAVVVVHNHPSGDPEPSLEDVEVTRRLIEAGRLLGIPLLDHVVVGDGRFASLRERMSFER
jgi:DNA repair protein RadC